MLIVLAIVFCFHEILQRTISIYRSSFVDAQIHKDYLFIHIVLHMNNNFLEARYTCGWGGVLHRRTRPNITKSLVW